MYNIRPGVRLVRRKGLRTMWKEVNIREILFEVCHDLCQVVKLRCKPSALYSHICRGFIPVPVNSAVVEDAAEFFLLKSFIHGMPLQSK
jgi:hypothetical protein